MSRGVWPSRSAPRDWIPDGECHGTLNPVFFPGRTGDTHAELRAARKICAGCTARPDCLDYAIQTRQPYGVWGGATTKERDAIRLHGVPRRVIWFKGDRLVSDVADRMRRVIKSATLG